MDRRRLWLVGVGVVGIVVMLAVRWWTARSTEPKPSAAPPAVTSSSRSRLAPVLQGSERPEGSAGQPGTPRAPDTRKVPPQVVHDLSAKLQAAMTACAAQIPRNARGSHPKVDGTLVVDITGGEIKVTEASVQLQDVQGDSSAAAKRCLEQAWVGQTTAATGVEDTTRYSIAVAFALPPA